MTVIMRSRKGTFQQQQGATTMSESVGNASAGSKGISRRDLLQHASLGVAGALTLGVSGALRAEAEEPAAIKKRIKQSIVQWCYQKYWNIEQMCQMAKKLG